MSKTNRVNKSAICKNCLHSLDAATSVNNDQSPSEDDLSVCAYCGTISKFDSILCLKPLSDIELDILESSDPEIWTMLTKMQSLIKCK